MSWELADSNQRPVPPWPLAVGINPPARLHRTAELSWRFLATTMSQIHLIGTVFLAPPQSLGGQQREGEKDITFEMQRAVSLLSKSDPIGPGHPPFGLRQHEDAAPNKGRTH